VLAGIFPPVWNIRLACSFARGKKLARLPSYVNVGACHLMHSSIRGSAARRISRIRSTTGFIGLS
jgi:hypothetical protein